MDPTSSRIRTSYSARAPKDLLQRFAALDQQESHLRSEIRRMQMKNKPFGMRQGWLAATPRKVPPGGR